MENIKSNYSIRIGNTTFIVNAKTSENAKKPLDTVLRGLCKREISGDFLTFENNLEKIRKTS